MATIINLDRLKGKLRDRIGKVAKDTSDLPVVVGYIAVNYAIYVHENLEAHHKVGQAKFLEAPARRMTNDGTFKKLLNDNMATGMTLQEALLTCGERLQRESQLLVPVDTGNLKGSAFADYEKNMPTVSKEILKKQEKLAKRLDGKKKR